MKGFAFLLLVTYFDVVLLIMRGTLNEDYSDQKILDRINKGGKCYHMDNMLFYPIRNTFLIDADSVVFEFKGATNYTLMCCMFNETLFVNSSSHKIQSCTRNTPVEIQRFRGVSCCKFYHRITFRSGFVSHVMKPYTSDTSDTWGSLTSLTARITSEQIRIAAQRSRIEGKMDQVVYEGFFQLHYPKMSQNVEKPIFAPSKPGKSYIKRTWQLVNGLPDVHIAVETKTAVPGVVISCSVNNATTPRVRLYPSLEPNVFKGKCHFHTMRIRSHEPRASTLKNSRATYAHFSLPQVATYVTARAWSTFPKCAFQMMGQVSTVSVTVRCRTSVAKSQAFADAWSADSVQMTLYNPSVQIKNKQARYYFTDTVKLGFIFSKFITSPYSLEIVIPTSSQKALFLVPQEEATLYFYKNAMPGNYKIETKVVPKRRPSMPFIDDNDLIFRDTLTLNLNHLKPVVYPHTHVHNVLEIVRCKASNDRDEFRPYLRWDIGDLDVQVRSKLVMQDNGTAFVFIETVKEKHQSFTFYCRLGSSTNNTKSVKYTFKVSGKPRLKLHPMRLNYYMNDLVTCETDRKSYGEVILRPLNLCKDEGSWCQRRIEDALQKRSSSNSFTFPLYLKEAEYKIQCEIKPFNSTSNSTTKLFTILYNGVQMILSPDKTRFNFHTEISCVSSQFKDRSVYFIFPLKWTKFVHITKPGSFYISDLPVQGWVTFFCGLSDFETRVGKNFTIFIEDHRFGKMSTRSKRQQHGPSYEFYTYALLLGFMHNMLLLYVAFAINFLIRVHEARRVCVRRFIEKYNIAAYNEATPGFFNDLLTFACDENLIRSAPEAKHFNTTN